MAKLKDPGGDDKPQKPQPAPETATNDPHVLEQLQHLAQAQPHPTPAQRWADHRASPAVAVAPPVLTPSDVVHRPLYPHLSPSVPWYYVFNPLRWQVLGDRVLPCLAKLQCRGGVNGAHEIDLGGGKTRTDMRQAIQGIRDDQRDILQWNVLGPDYIKAVKVGEALDKKRGEVVPLYVWLSRWENAFPGSDIVEVDEQGYQAWLGELIDRGILPRPTWAVFEKLEKQTRFYMEHQALKRGKDHELVLNYQRQIEVIRKERATAHEAAQRLGPVGTVQPTVDILKDGPPDEPRPPAAPSLRFR